MQKGERILTTHIWQEYLNLAEQLRRTERGKDIYVLRKETIKRGFAALNLKKLDLCWATHPFLYRLFACISTLFLAQIEFF